MKIWFLLKADSVAKIPKVTRQETLPCQPEPSLLEHQLGQALPTEGVAFLSPLGGWEMTPKEDSPEQGQLVL